MELTPGRALAARLWWGVLGVLILATLIAQCFLTHSQGRSLLDTFSYFTIQSNLLVIVTSLVLAVKPDVSGTWWRILRLAAVCGITVTGIVYATVLAPYVHLSGIAVVYNALFHYVSPWATVLGFLLIGPRSGFRRFDLWYLAWPVLWLVYTMLRGAYGDAQFTGFGETPSNYPYAFLDVDQEGWGIVVGAIVIIAALLVGIGLLYLWADGRLLQRQRRRADA